VRDFCIDQRFRCDVFARDAPPLAADEQRRRLLDAGLALVRPPSGLSYRAETPAGTLDYASGAARSIVAGLAGGAGCLADIATGDAEAQDLVANALALCAAEDVRPVEKARVPVGPINDALRRRLGTSEEIPLLALPCGTAIEIDPRIAAGENRAWRQFLALHGL